MAAFAKLRVIISTSVTAAGTTMGKTVRMQVSTFWLIFWEWLLVYPLVFVFLGSSTVVSLWRLLFISLVFGLFIPYAVLQQ